MYLKNLKIRNYRNFYKANIDLNSEDNMLIGDNGSGKTNLFSAIRLVLDVNYRLENFLCEKDFNQKTKPNLFGNWIIISATLTGFEDNEDNVSRHDFSVDDEGNAYINFIFKPKDKILDMLYESYQELRDLDSEEAELKIVEIRDFIQNLSIETDYEVVRTFKKMFDYFDDEKYYSVIGEFRNVLFGNDNYKNSQFIGVPEKVQNALKQINVTYIPPIRDVRENLASSNGMFSKLINDSYDNISEADKNDISSKVIDLNDRISSIEQFQRLKDDMHEKMDIVGKNYFDSKFEIESNISNDKKELVKSLSLKIADYDEIVDIWRKSLGEANVIYFALQLLESEKRQGTFRSTILDLLLIEEPEAHIHGHLQKALFRNLKENKSRQLIISTHSVNISEVSKISKMLILNDGFMETVVCNPSKGLDKKEIRRVERYLDANRSMLLFSKNVIMVEGDAENIVIPWLVYKNFNITLDEMGISLINVNSTFFKAILPLFSKERIIKKCAVITDLDTDYTSDNSKQEAQRNGLIRKNELESITGDNIYINSYYALNTFEIQMFEIDANKQILIDMIKSDENILYSRNSTKVEKETALNNPQTQKETIMNVVEYKKKGWFALEFIEYCENNNLTPDIPAYIFDALKWIIINKNNYNLTKWCLLSLMEKIEIEDTIISNISVCNDFEELKLVLKDFNTENLLLSNVVLEILNVN